MRQPGDLSMPSGVSKRGQFAAVYTTNISGFDFRQARVTESTNLAQLSSFCVYSLLSWPRHSGDPS
jgi:hypothetical protein